MVDGAGVGRPANSGLSSSRSTPTSDASVAAAAERVRSEYGRLDVLVNNAGTAEPRVGAADLTAEEAMRGFGINVFGPIRVMHAFLPLLRASDNPRIVNVSSGAGSFARILTPGTVENAVTLPVYPATKSLFGNPAWGVGLIESGPICLGGTRFTGDDCRCLWA